VVHIVLLALLAHRSRVWVAPVRMPGTAHGMQEVLTYLPGTAPSAPGLVARVAAAHKVALPRHAPAPVKPADAPAVGIVHENPGSGLDALGDGDVSIALMQFFPDPRPDLSRLPQGSRGDVVLEAVIDADGRVAQLTVKQGLGYGVDESVIATVEQWIFHPAMRNGKPVASLQEFHFHYERG
jgi:protein TonB